MCSFLYKIIISSVFQIQITALCMCVSISATVALGCLFVPKVYIVLFQPHKNVRQGAKGSVSGLAGRPFFGRPSSRFTSLSAMNGDITSPSNCDDNCNDNDCIGMKDLHQLSPPTSPILVTSQSNSDVFHDEDDSLLSHKNAENNQGHDWPKSDAESETEIPVPCSKYDSTSL